MHPPRTHAEEVSTLWRISSKVFQSSSLASHRVVRSGDFYLALMCWQHRSPTARAHIRASHSRSIPSIAADREASRRVRNAARIPQKLRKLAPLKRKQNMNIYEFCETFSISMKKARRMEKEGVLRLDERENPSIAEIRRQLSKGQPLTVAQFTALADDPSILKDLGRYEREAKKQLLALGPAKECAAPLEIAAMISEASRGHDEALAVIIAWLKEIIPSYPVVHQWIGTRLLIALPTNIRKFDAPRVPQALAHCRKHPDFAGWWRVETVRNRPVSIYQRPEPEFDL